MYEGRTIQEAVRKWRQDALPHISAIARAFGIPFDNANAWVESGHIANRYTRPERDIVQFIAPKTEKIRRIMGDVRPVGEQKNELAIVDDAGPNDYDTEETLSWSRSTTKELSDVESAMQGWSITITQGYEIGGDASGGKYIGGLELGTYGEYSHERAESSGIALEGMHSTKVNLPEGEIARLLQTVRTGEIEIDVTDYIVLELGWKIGDWKRRFNSNLDHHSGGAMLLNSRGTRTRSRWHWDCLSTEDFYGMMHGGNPRYPATIGITPLSWGNVREHGLWLLEEDNRTIKVSSKARFLQGVWGNAQVQRIGINGEVMSEFDAA